MPEKVTKGVCVAHRKYESQERRRRGKLAYKKATGNFGMMTGYFEGDDGKKVTINRISEVEGDFDSDYGGVDERVFKIEDAYCGTATIKSKKIVVGYHDKSNLEKVLKHMEMAKGAKIKLNIFD